MTRASAIALILALVLLLTAVPAIAAGATLVSAKGIELRLLEYSISSVLDPMITLRIRGINDTDHRVWVELKDVKVNGIPVTSTLRSIPDHTDTGDDDPLLYSVRGSEDDGGAGYSAISNARTLEMRVNVQDNDTYETIIDQKVTIDLTKTVDGSVSTGNSSGYDTYTMSQYDALKKGSKGQAVRELQQRLIDLGFLTGKADGSYGKQTADAVRLFCEQNGLAVDGSGAASPEVQERLFSSSAKGYSEAYNPLTIEKGKWDPVRRVNTFFFKAQLKNTSRTRTVKGVELSLYYTDVWGKKLDGGVTYTQSNKLTLAPGKTGWSNSFNLGNWYSVDTVWIGVSKIVFDDGEIREISDVDYYSVQLPDKK